MLIEKTTNEMHICDICKKRRLSQTSIKKCNKCGKELCTYCKIKLTKTIRKYPDSGYFQIQECVGYLCFKDEGYKDG